MAGPRAPPQALARWAPGLALLFTLDGPAALRDLGAGLAVAAVAVPIGLAYATLAGVPTAVGLFASVMPVAAYALFGPSPRLVVGPDTATCTVLAAALTALALEDPQARAEGAAAIALLAGLGAMLAARLRLGGVANLLSKPVLAGYLAGIAISLFAGQLSSLTGIPLRPEGVIRTLLDLFTRWREVHVPTAILGLSLFAALMIFKAFTPRLPGPAFVVAAAIFLSWGLDLHRMGVAELGEAPSGLPSLRVPGHMIRELDRLVPAAAAVLVVSFASGVVTARSFAARTGDRVDPNRELAGFGVADVAAGLFQGFPVTGADSRTAVMLASGGRGPLVGLTAAATVGLVLLFLSAPLAYLPDAALGAVLASAAVGLVDVKTFRQLARIDRNELILALASTGGVLWLGVMKGVALGVGLTLLHLILVVARPREAVLGRSAAGDWLTAHRDPAARPVPGAVVWLFEASVFFLNAEYFQDRALAALDASPGARLFVLDATSMTFADTAAADAFAALKRELDRRGVEFAVVGGHGRFRTVLERAGLADAIGRDHLFDGPAAALAALKTRRDS